MKVLFIGVLLLVASTFVQPASAGLIFDSTVSSELKTQILSDLKFINEVRSQKATPLHAEVFGKVDGKAYTRWFQNRVNTFSFGDCGGPRAVACAQTRYPKVIFIAESYIKFAQPQIARISVLFHEARHNEEENGGWPHDTCPTPFKNNGIDVRSIWTQALLEGRPACDQTIYGSYGTQTILLKNIALNCSNCTEKMKTDAELYANDQAIRIISTKAKAALKKDFLSR